MGFLQDLSNNHIRSEGAEDVAKMLLDSISLKSIKLSGNVLVNLFRYTSSSFWRLM